MELPPIPEAAVVAVLDNAGVIDTDECEAVWAREDLTAAFPHLYAASLRHAADVLDDWEPDSPAVRCLRRFASEVAP